MDISSLPQVPGVYLMRAADSKIIYVGKAKNLAKRVAQYFQTSRAGSQSGWKIPNLVALIRRIDYIPCESERDALVLERQLIHKHQPFFNSMWKDDKSYPYVKITLEDFPRMLMTRRKMSDGARYFGPYPEAFALRQLLHHLWRTRALPLRPCKWTFSETKPLPEKTINSCVYYNTHQCPAPCAGDISPQDYRAIARRAEKFFAGGFAALKKEMEKLMRRASDKMEYEDAAAYRNFIRTMEHMAQRVAVSRYKDDELSTALAKAAAAARLRQVLGLAKDPLHIESFDTSNLFGRHAVGSMVCFVNGKSNKRHYRRFKIKSALPLTGGDDFLMIKEIVGRRLRALAREEHRPDLFLIDGGQGQLAAAMQAASEQKMHIPMASLAKREEEIFVPGRRESIRLEKSDAALRLLMEIRDETHRFGIKYHRFLRDRELLEDK